MIQVSNISIQFGGEYLFKDVSFNINPKDRIALIGKNGAGKTTLLNVISGFINSEIGGNIVKSENDTIGYLPQKIELNSKQTVYNETLKAFSSVIEIEKEIIEINNQIAEREDYQSESYIKLLDKLEEKHRRFEILGGNQMTSSVEKVLKGLGFSADDFNCPMNEFSGGWQMRVELAKLILQQPSLLLLDEPTNHLDIESIMWLEEYFKSYPGSIMLVSHDRTFLDNVTNRTIEISYGKTYDYKATYTEFIRLREERLEQQESEFINQQKYISDQEKFIERFRYKSTKSKQVQSRIKTLDKLDIVNLDNIDKSSIDFKFPPAPRSGKVVVDAKNLTKKYGDKLILDGVELLIERGEKVAFTGRNGEGKSTLVRLLNGEETFDGFLETGHNVSIGYYAQVQEHTLNENLTVLETISNEAKDEWSNITKIRSLLGAFLFDGDSVDKKVKILSGGERSRLALAKLLLRPVNLLILDEPTNHLDIRAKEVLKNALNLFDGTLIIVSHDRDFLNGLTNKTFEFRDHKIKEYIGGIEIFLEKRRLDSFRTLELKKKEEAISNEKTSDNKEKYLLKKEHEKTKRKIEKQIEECEKNITEIERSIQEIETNMLNPEFFADTDNAKENSIKHDELNNNLLFEMENWEKLSAILEEHLKLEI